MCWETRTRPARGGSSLISTSKLPIAIVDFGAGNLRSVVKALAWLGYPARVTADPAEVLEAEVAILPGVGAAAKAMEQLQAHGLIEPIRQRLAEDRPFFGVCLGFQLLFTSTEEGGGCGCLGILPGRVRRLPRGLKVPHMGWNQVHHKLTHPLFEGIPQGANFYFVHSYYAEPEEPSLVAAETEYSIPFASLIIRGNLVATQFHPEKSGHVGLRLYENFLKYCRPDGQ